jgi:hypothetical protein
MAHEKEGSRNFFNSPSDAEILACLCGVLPLRDIFVMGWANLG